MSSLERTARVGLAFIVLYLGVVVVHGPTNLPEAFPFFSWSLFSKVPGPEQVDYGIRLTSVDGEVLEEPVYFEDATFLPNRTAPSAYQTIQQLGRAMERDQPLAASRARDVLEDRHMGPLDQADYEVVRRDIDIVESHRCDCFQGETVLAEHSKAG